MVPVALLKAVDKDQNQLGIIKLPCPLIHHHVVLFHDDCVIYLWEQSEVLIHLLELGDEAM